jgi:hypothetical protein
MKRFAASAHASTLVLLAGFTAAAFGLGGDELSLSPAQARTSDGQLSTVVASAEAADGVPVETSGFMIGGDVRRPLVPGSRVPVNLRLTNTMHHDLRVNRLTITVTDVRKAGRRSTCRPADFVVRPARLDRPVRLDAGVRGTLRSLRLAPWRWPRIGMLNLPVNQDDCKGVELTLTFDGSARPVPL